MRICCLLTHNLAVQLALRGNPELRGQPLLIAEPRPGGDSVRDASPEAMAYGVRSGMPLREALALCPPAACLPVDERRYERAFEALVAVLDRFSPAVEVERPDCAYLDISGHAHEETLAYQILGAVAADTELRASAAVSSGKFFAWVAAFSARAEVPVIIPPDAEADFIAPFSITLLPCPDKTRERLNLLGIHRIGELTGFSLEALTAQFGREGVILYEITHGVDSSPIVPRKKPEVMSAVARFEPPVENFIEILITRRAEFHGLCPWVNEIS